MTSGFSVLLGNGDGTFQAEKVVTHGGCGSDQGMVVGDFNRDGRDDFAGSGVVELSKGDGTFTAVCNNIVGANVVADFNHDGNPDLVTLASGGRTSVYLGNGDGTFQAPIGFQSSLSSPLTNVGPLTAIDFNGDGKIDLAGNGEENTVTVVLGNGDGTFRVYTVVSDEDDQVTGFTPLTFTVADLRSDGKADFVAFGYSQEDGIGYVLTLLGNGNGTFQPPDAFFAGEMTFAGAVGDFNSDGKPDLVTIGYGPQVGVLLGNGDGTFQNAVFYDPMFVPTAVGVGDFNGDGNQDIVVAGVPPSPPGGSATVELFLGAGNGTFGFPTTIATASASALVVGDLNGDGKPDILGLDGGVWVLINNGGGTFQAPQNIVGVTGATGFALADLNHDGKLDLAVAVAGGVQILLGNGDGTFQLGGTFATAPSPNSVAVADFNGDGILDLAVGAGSSVSVLVGNGDGTFQSPVNYDGPGGGNVVAADFNGDGMVDIAANGITLLFNGVGVRTLGLGIPPGGSDSATVTAGSTATYTLSIGGAGINGTATLTCTGAPKGATCTVPGTENVSATTASTFNVTVSTAGSSAALQQEELVGCLALGHGADRDGMAASRSRPPRLRQERRSNNVAPFSDIPGFVRRREWRRWRRRRWWGRNSGGYLYFDGHGHHGRNESITGA